MSCAAYLDGNATPKSMSRAKQWTDEVENLYRFQQAGYRDELEYKQVKQVDLVNNLNESLSLAKSIATDSWFTTR
jgi:hypothetical protein